MRLIWTITAVLFLFLLVSCTQEESLEQTEDVRDAKTVLMNYLSTSVPTYSATYEHSSSTSGSNNKDTFYVEVVENELVLYSSDEGHDYSDGRSVCTKRYTGGDSWEICSCIKWDQEENVIGETSCLDSDIPTNTDKMYKEAALAHVQDDENSLFASFEIDDGRNCYVYNGGHGSLWCFTDDGLLVTLVSSIGYHPSPTNVVGYPYDEEIQQITFSFMT